MARLDSVKRDAKKTYEEHKSHLPEVPKIPLVEATTISAKALFSPQTITVGTHGLIQSEPIYLQTKSETVHSFAVDLSALNPKIVFSVILANSNDVLGRKPNTILVRNGVTATAARKRANREMVWFYHGKPMNDGDMRLHVTIGRDQMTFAYQENGRMYVHGDCPVSWLTEDHIGNVEGMPFYVFISTNDKSRVISDPVTIEVLDIEEKGYIFEPMSEEERDNFGFKLIHPWEATSEQEVEQTGEDHELVDGLAGMKLE